MGVAHGEADRGGLSPKQRRRAAQLRGDEVRADHRDAGARDVVALVGLRNHAIAVDDDPQDQLRAHRRVGARDHGLRRHVVAACGDHRHHDLRQEAVPGVHRRPDAEVEPHVDVCGDAVAGVVHAIANVDRLTVVDRRRRVERGCDEIDLPTDRDRGDAVIVELVVLVDDVAGIHPCDHVPHPLGHVRGDRDGSRSCRPTRCCDHADRLAKQLRVPAIDALVGGVVDRQQHPRRGFCPMVVHGIRHRDLGSRGHIRRAHRQGADHEVALGDDERRGGGVVGLVPFDNRLIWVRLHREVRDRPAASRHRAQSDGERVGDRRPRADRPHIHAGELAVTTIDDIVIGETQHHRDICNLGCAVVAQVEADGHGLPLAGNGRPANRVDLEIEAVDGVARCRRVVRLV